MMQLHQVLPGCNFLWTSFSYTNETEILGFNEVQLHFTFIVLTWHANVLKLNLTSKPLLCFNTSSLKVSRFLFYIFSYRGCTKNFFLLVVIFLLPLFRVKICESGHRKDTFLVLNNPLDNSLQLGGIKTRSVYPKKIF